jgi:CRP/FNR family cyclic AMP-dependent transcriptional regulator
MAAGLPKMQPTRYAPCEAPSLGLFEHLSIEEQSQLHASMRHRIYDSGEIIFSQGDVISGFWRLCRGKVQLSRLMRDGSKQTVKLLRDGDCFGEEGFVQTSVSCVSAQALARSVVSWLSLADLHDFLRRSPVAALALLTKLSQEVSELRVRLAEQAHLGTYERLIKLLLELGEKYGSRSGGKVVINVELTEQGLADMLGNTRVWVCRQLSVLRERGLIAYRRGELVILNEAALRQLAPPPPRRDCEIFLFWSDVADMCKVIYTMSVNYFIDKGGESA